ncbi:lipase, partial [Candidatus Magnetomorum sp. HK-1]
MFIKRSLSVIFLGIFIVFGFAGPAMSGITAEILSNSNSVSTLTVNLGDTVDFEHGGSYCCGFLCTSSFDFSFEIQYDGTSTWETIESGSYLPTSAETEFRFLRLGTHKVKLSIDCSGVSTDTVDVTVQCASTGSCNNYPIVLVHGFLGWGREEVELDYYLGSKTLYYWGGTDSGDLEKEMNDRGFIVYTASVGPVTSAWDRACELYAQLMGTDVFYGAEHASEHNNVYVDSNGNRMTSITSDTACDNDTDCIGKYTHAETGNDRKNDAGHASDGRLKNSDGDVIPKLIDGSTVNPIHLVSHSFGGQTIRVLAALLGEGSPNCTGNPGSKTCENSANASDLQEKLFIGGNTGAIRSVTTIATPNDGTNLTWVVNDLLDSLGSDSFGVDIFELLLSETVTEGLSSIYDFDIDQWDGPGTASNNNGVRDADVMIKKTCGTGEDELCGFNECTEAKPSMYDFSMWDLSPCGAAAINSWADAQDDIYYFSVTTEQAFRCSTDDQWYCELPTRTALPLYWFPDSPTDNWGSNFFSILPSTDSMGFDDYTTDEGLSDSNVGASNTSPQGGSWKEHDGVVSTPAMSKASCDVFTTEPNGEVGKWKSFGVFHEDH